MTKHLNFLNVTRVYPDNIDFTISEVRRQHLEVGLNRFALCLSFHPTGASAIVNARKLIDAFAAVKAAVADEPGIEIGVLIQSTLGHGWSGNVPLTDEKWQRTVRNDGTVSSRMCPLDPGFRKYVLEVVEGLMKVGPAFLLMDDDFGMRSGECFCPLHCAMFNKAAGKNYSREEIAEIAAKQSADDEEKLLFWHQRRDTIVPFAHEVRQVIDKYNPDCVCTMCSPGEGHGFVNAVTHELAGKSALPSVRVNNAFYGSSNPIDLLFATLRTNRVRHVFKDVPDMIDEADTFPQTYYSENAVMFNAHLVSGILAGLTGAKLWMFEFDLQENIGSQSCYEEIFRTNRGLYEELYNTVEGVSWKGIKTPLPEYGDLSVTEVLNKKLYTLDFNTSISGILALPCSYGLPTEDGIFALNRNTVEELSDAEIKTLFSKNLLIDSEAAKALDARGFSEFMGVRIGNNPLFFFTQEQCCDMDYPTGLMWDDMSAELVCLSDKTQIASWCMLNSPNTGKAERVSPCMTYFTNALGGRVAVLAWSSAAPFYKIERNSRRLYLLKALDFLNGDRFEMSLENKHQAFIRHGTLADGTELVAVINLALDATPAVPLRCASAPKAVTRLMPDGQWQPIGFTYADGILTIHEALPCLGVLIFKLAR